MWIGRGEGVLGLGVFVFGLGLIGKILGLVFMESVGKNLIVIDVVFVFEFLLLVFGVVVGG